MPARVVTVSSLRNDCARDHELTLWFPLEICHLLRAREHLAVDIEFTTPPRDQVRVLRAKIENQNGVERFCARERGHIRLHLAQKRSQRISNANFMNAPVMEWASWAGGSSASVGGAMAAMVTKLSSQAGMGQKTKLGSAKARGG